MKHVFGDTFFYMVYFQDVGPAETELEKVTRLAFRHMQSPHNVPAGMEIDSGRGGLLKKVPAPEWYARSMHRAGDGRSAPVRAAS